MSEREEWCCRMSPWRALCRSLSAELKLAAPAAPGPALRHEGCHRRPSMLFEDIFEVIEDPDDTKKFRSGVGLACA